MGKTKKEVVCWENDSGWNCLLLVGSFVFVFLICGCVLVV